MAEGLASGGEQLLEAADRVKSLYRDPQELRSPEEQERPLVFEAERIVINNPTPEDNADPAQADHAHSGGGTIRRSKNLAHSPTVASGRRHAKVTLSYDFCGAKQNILLSPEPSVKTPTSDPANQEPRSDQSEPKPKDAAPAPTDEPTPPGNDPAITPNDAPEPTSTPENIKMKQEIHIAIAEQPATSEDKVLRDDKKLLYAVIKGLPNHENADVAAQEIVDALDDEFWGNNQEPVTAHNAARLMRDALKHAQTRLVEAAEEGAGDADMAAAASVFKLFKNPNGTYGLVMGRVGAEPIIARVGDNQGTLLGAGSVSNTFVARKGHQFEVGDDQLQVIPQLSDGMRLGLLTHCVKEDGTIQRLTQEEYQQVFNQDKAQGVADELKSKGNSAVIIDVEDKGKDQPPASAAGGTRGSKRGQNGNGGTIPPTSPGARRASQAPAPKAPERRSRRRERFVAFLAGAALATLGWGIEEALDGPPTPVQPAAQAQQQGARGVGVGAATANAIERALHSLKNPTSPAAKPPRAVASQRHDGTWVIKPGDNPWEESAEQLHVPNTPAHYGQIAAYDRAMGEMNGYGDWLQSSAHQDEHLAPGAHLKLPAQNARYS